MKKIITIFFFTHSGQVRFLIKKNPALKAGFLELNYLVNNIIAHLLLQNRHQKLQVP